MRTKTFLRSALCSGSGIDERGKVGRGQTCCSLRWLARGSLYYLLKVIFVLKPLRTNVITLEELSVAGEDVLLARLFQSHDHTIKSNQTFPQEVLGLEDFITPESTGGLKKLRRWSAHVAIPKSEHWETGAIFPFNADCQPYRGVVICKP